MTLRRLPPRAVSFAVLLVAGAAGAAPLSPVPLAVGFPDTDLGVESAGVDVTLTSTANSAITVVAVTVVGANPGDFVASPRMAPPFALAAGASTSVTVACAPRHAGPLSTALEVQLGDGLGSVDVPLRCNGIGPLLVATPSGLSFGGSRVGVAKTADLVLANAQAGTVTIKKGGFVVYSLDPRGTPADFVPVNAPADIVVLGPHNQGAITVTMRFTPAAAGPRSATLQVQTDPPGVGIGVPLGGQAGDPSLGLDIDALVFADTAVGAMGPVQPITLRNNGGADLHIATIAVAAIGDGGAPPQDFVLTHPPLPLVLPFGQEAVVGVAFAPTQRGLREAKLVFDSDDPVPKGASLRGTGRLAADLGAPPPDLPGQDLAALAAADAGGAAGPPGCACRVGAARNARSGGVAASWSTALVVLGGLLRRRRR